MMADIKNILLVEDNQSDIRIITQSLAGQFNIDVVNDGNEAIEYLKNKVPHFIILDLNLIQMNGKEVIKRIKSNNRLRTIPVIVYTTSRNKDDIKELYELGANAYITKPFNLSQAKKVLSSLGDFWGIVSFNN